MYTMPTDADSSMSDLDALLETHRAVVRHDRQLYFADSAAAWTDAAGQTRRRYPANTLLAQSPNAPPLPRLSLGFVGRGWPV